MSMSWDDLMKQAEEAGLAFEPVPGGQYELEVVKADPNLSSSGKPMLKMRYKIADGPFVGKAQYDQIVLTKDNPNAMAFFFRHMAAFGFGKDFFASCPPPEAGGLQRIATAMAGRRVSATIGVREWPASSGQFRNEITAYSVSRGPQQAAPQVGGIPGVAAPSYAGDTSRMPPVIPQPQPQQGQVPGAGPHPVFQPVAQPQPEPQPQPPQPQPQTQEQQQQPQQDGQPSPSGAPPVPF